MATQYDSMITQTTAPSAVDPLIAGNSMPRVDKAITIKTGQAALTRGTLLMLSSGKAIKYDAVDPTTLIGVLAIDTAAASADIPAYMWVTGELNIDVVTTAMGGAPAAAAITQLETMNIYLKKVV